MGLQAQLPQVADEGAADTDGEEEGEQERDQAECAGDDRLGDDAHGHGVDAVLVAVVGLVVEGTEFVEDVTGGAVPALGGDPAGGSGAGVEGGFLGHAQRCGGCVLPEALIAVALRHGQQRQIDVVHQRALGHEVGDVALFGGGDPADDQGGAEEGVLSGEQFAGTGEIDQRAVLLVQFHVVDHVQVGQQHVAGIDQPVVEAQGLGAVDGAVLDAAAQRLDAFEGVQDRGQSLVGAGSHRVAHVRVPGVLADAAHGLVGRGPAAPERGEPVGGTGVGEVDEGLAAFLLQDADRVLDGVADLLHHGRHVEQVARLTSREHRGESPDRGQGHQRHEEQRHDLPADGLPAKAHGLPQLGPPGPPGVHMCVNKRREPTTDEQGTRRPVRNVNFRATERACRVVRALRELSPRNRWWPHRPTSVACLGGWLKFFVLWESSWWVARPSLQETGAESATGAASRTWAA